jgi:hypothetical protein
VARRRNWKLTTKFLYLREGLTRLLTFKSCVRNAMINITDIFQRELTDDELSITPYEAGSIFDCMRYKLPRF